MSIKVIKKELPNWNNLVKETLLVGYPEGPRHSDSKLTNAQIAFLNSEGTRKKSVSKAIKNLQESYGAYSLALQAYIRSKGDPLWNIPPRPFIEPGLDTIENEIKDDLGKILLLSLEKKETRTTYELLGLKAVNAIQRFIRNYPKNGLEANAPSTIKRKGFDHPLIGETGELLRSVTYVIKDASS